MRFVVIGAGAIGGVVGGRLAQHGADVLLVARGAHGEAIAREGLHIADPTGTTTVRPPVVPSVRAVTPADGDVVLVATKSQDTAGVLRDLVTAVPDTTPVVSLQNGVDNERAILRHFPDTYGVCVMSPCTHLEPGVVMAHSHPVSGILDIGRYPHGTDALTEAVAAVLRASTFESEPRADIMRWKYTKLLMNLANAIEALCGVGARFGELATRVRDEGEACLRAAGIDHASPEEDAERRGDLLRIGPGDGRPWQGGSTWQSLARGTGEVEVDWLNGEISLLGRLHGIATPANDLLAARTRAAAAAGTEPGTIAERDLLATLDLPNPRN